MAEIATIARPYAEALFKAAGGGADAFAWKQQVDALGVLAADEGLQALAANPKVGSTQVFDVMAGVALQKGLQLDAKVVNLLRTVLDNGRLAALPEVAHQFGQLVNRAGGSAEAWIDSAFPLDAAQVSDVLPALEKRFGRKLVPSVRHMPELIGGIRVTVGDEVLDTSVLARLQQMKAALVT
jgi:F-type H+-transporting ATPase subunit delta